MPEIGYWKYVRFLDDEPQYWGTDDDIVQIFDSADDRLEYRMKKDIRFEDDVGNEILTIDKANRHVEIPVQLNVAALEEYAPGAGITVRGTLMFSGADLDLAGNLLKNPKLGTNLNVNNYRIVGLAGDAGQTIIGGGSDGSAWTGAIMAMYGKAFTGKEGMIELYGGRASGGAMRVLTFNAALTGYLFRLIINQGDIPDIDVVNSRLDFHDQTLEATAGASAGYFKIKVGGTEYKVQAFALT